MSNTINETRSFVQGKLAEFCKKVSREQTRPVQKFYYDMLMGLCGTGSPSLHNFARMLMDNCSLEEPEDWCSFCESQTVHYEVEKAVEVVNLAMNISEANLSGRIDVERLLKTGLFP